MNYVFFLLCLLLLPAYAQRRAIFHTLTMQQQALVFNLIPLAAGISLPLLPSWKSKAGLSAAFVCFTHVAIQRWGSYHRCSAAIMYEHALLGAIIGCVVVGIKKYRETRDIQHSLVQPPQEQ